MLSNQDLLAIQKIKRKLIINTCLTRVGYGCLVLAFISFVLATPYTIYCFIGTGMLLSTNLFNHDLKQLLFILDKLKYQDASNIIKAAQLHDS